jgi:hypothetical protein
MVQGDMGSGDFYRTKKFLALLARDIKFPIDVLEN